MTSSVTKLTRSGVGVLLAVALTGTGAISAEAAQASPAAAVGITQSNALATNVVAAGTIVDVDGDAAPAGTVVSLRAWPSNAVLGSMKVGDRVRAETVGYAVTEPGGSFELRVDPAANLAGFTNDGGVLNAEIVSLVDNLPISYGLPIDVAHATAATSDRARSTAAPAAVVQTGLKLAPVSKTPVAQTKTSQTAPSVAAAPPGCFESLIQDLGGKWVNVGEVYTTAGSSAVFTYKSGQSSSLGVGFSATGDAGTFTASGTASVTASASITFPTVSQSAGKIFRTQFRYGKFSQDCTPDSGSPVHSIIVRPTAFLGGSQANTTTRPTATFCTAAFAANSIFTINSTSAYKFSSGVTISPSIGINLSSQTGFTSTASVKFTLTTSGRKVCGTNGVPGSGTPQRLVVK